ncbi:betaine/proline/choline family ABC transporter ATP-binding protein [Micromonospora sp. U21]|uniref:betaine/proline/choline family ABC transporter ATP-binding protein n=1 Tax=Micromonospora sp. U21 TaxID=2824899 RepID=UPI001B3623A2|nr:betaine/proline/choline family ABC transporter ATP-binding protein [Micromonospora sp. U21]MBQ0902407.1 betaine/proline/choline family ABC transporter ATP-binding protein [Micromonospora sp. U21]
MTDDVMIELQQVSKSYRGQKAPAVENVSMTIRRGEIVVLVGPSGCGKTTTMKMINRLIEPTSGRILVDGSDVTSLNPTELRRRIGYVIQQVGLFPHMSVATNVGLVPKMLGWSRTRIDARVDELLDLVGLEPGQFRHRLPRQLSGGQQQRVGVARALAADPPVMLMDEPFGATDPLTRDRLQNEFLRLQEKLQKTIVFVTHDFDEAIKMGSRIAVLGERSSIRQFDTPEQLLGNPADQTVAQFIGAGASLKQLNLRRVDGIDCDEAVLVQLNESPASALRRLDESGEWALLAVDSERRPLRWVTARDLDPQQNNLDGVGVAATTVDPRATLHDALDAMLASSSGAVVVVDEAGRYRGVVNIDRLMRVIAEMRETERRRHRLVAESPDRSEGTTAGMLPTQGRGTPAIEDRTSR